MQVEGQATQALAPWVKRFAEEAYNVTVTQEIGVPMPVAAFGQAVAGSWSFSTTKGVTTGSFSDRWTPLTRWRSECGELQCAYEDAGADRSEKLLRRRRGMCDFHRSLVRAELQGLIRLHREESWRHRNELRLVYDDGWVRCLDWEGAGLEVPENGVLTAAHRRVVGSWWPIHRPTEIVDLEEEVGAYGSVHVENGDEYGKEVSWEADAVIVGDAAVKREGSAGVQYLRVTADRVRQRTQRHFGSLSDLLGPTTPRNDGEGLRERLSVRGMSKAARGEAAPTESICAHGGSTWIPVSAGSSSGMMSSRSATNSGSQTSRFEASLERWPSSRWWWDTETWLFFDSSAETLKSASRTVSITRCGCSWLS